MSDSFTNRFAAPRLGRFARALSIALIITCGGCSSAYKKLISEDTVPVLAELKRKARAHSNASKHYPTQIGDGPVARVAIHETGAGPRDRLIVLLHGVPSDHGAWRFVRGALVENHRLVLVDLPGFGFSDKFRPKDLGPNAYSTDDLAERILQALQHFLADRPPASAPPAGAPPGSSPASAPASAPTDANVKITLVGHSLGGAVAARMMANLELRNRYASVTQKIDRLLLISPADAQYINPSPLMLKIATTSGLMYTIADAVGYLRELTARGAGATVDGSRTAFREEVDRLYAVLRCPLSRQAFQAALLATVPHDQDMKPDWPAIEKIVADYANIDVPCLLLWGARDETVHVSIGYKMVKQIPDAKLHVIPKCKHSPHIERPVECAKLIGAFSSAPDRAP